VAGCGEDEKAQQAAKPKSLQIEAAPGARLSAPRTVAPGVVEVRLRNSDKGPREAQLVRVEGGRTADQVVRVIMKAGEGGSIPAWIQDGGGVGRVKPGQTETVTEELRPGRYVVFDTEAEARQPPAAEFEVSGEATKASLPRTSARIVARDYSYEASGLKAGKNTITYENAGKELHHVLAFPLKPGATIEDLNRFIRTEKGDPPIDEESGDATAVIDGGRTQVAQLELKKGKYALVCFISDRRGGPPHAAKGMVTETTVR
jgi:hypothetical protein